MENPEEMIRSLDLEKYVVSYPKLSNCSRSRNKGDEPLKGG